MVGGDKGEGESKAVSQASRREGDSHIDKIDCTRIGSPLRITQTELAETWACVQDMARIVNVLCSAVPMSGVVTWLINPCAELERNIECRASLPNESFQISPLPVYELIESNTPSSQI